MARRNQEKTIIAKLNIKSGLDNISTLLVFAHASGVITYHLMHSTGYGNQCLSNLQVKHPLPCVEFDYKNTTELVADLTKSIKSGVETIISTKIYEG